MVNKVRRGCKDIWNAFMCEGAHFGPNDIPNCPTTAIEPPKRVITWDDAKTIYNKQVAKGNADFQDDAFVCWYMDDYKFDGERGIWHDPKFTLKVLSHFAGAITPDFSTNQDFPEPIKFYNTYRMRVYGYWLGKNSIPTINNVRWGTPESYSYCFEGIPRNSMIAIGTVGGSPRKLSDRERFENGLHELVTILSPHTIIVYGSANYSCFDELREDGINIIAYPSQTAQAFERGKHE